MAKICQVFLYHWQSDMANGKATAARPPKNLSIGLTDPETIADNDGRAMFPGLSFNAQQ